jgi:methylmalonyl-CoA mutase cobalamin-binding domain/chain
MVGAMSSSIHQAALQTGLTQHLLRIWEKRYQVVTPSRTSTRRRRYSTEDLRKLTLLRALTQAGRRIGDVAKLSTKELLALADRTQPEKPTANVRNFSADTAVGDALLAIDELDSRALAATLENSASILGQRRSIDQVISPIARAVGERWSKGSLPAAHEHFTSSIMRDHLLRHARVFDESPDAPLLVVATPAGQMHELGAAIVAAASSDLGWRVLYLGASLPASEIASAALRKQAAAVALSIVYPGDDPSLPGELKSLRTLLPPQITIIVGGDCSISYAPALKSMGAVHTNNLKGLYRHLKRVHSKRPVEASSKSQRRSQA